MTTVMTMGQPNRRPWHLWVVGVLSLLWNGFGVYDFIMTVSQGEAYMRSMGMTDPQITYFNAMPDWMYGPWFIGVFGALAGAILLLMRSRWALHAFALSLLGAAICVVYCFFLSNGAEVMGSMAYMQFVILAVAALLVACAWWVTKRGLLR